MEISIVVPVYKVEKELPRCIESLINQTYKKIEIVLVDDGSPDRCPIICEEYAAKDSRVKVIHKANGGLSDARNYGMEKATGEYILFVDSDDTIELNACERFAMRLSKKKVDLVIGECTEIHPNKITFQDHTNLDENVVYSAKEYLMKSIPINEFYCPAWLNLYRREFLIKNQLKFAVGLLHEDMEWTPKVFLKNPSVMYLKKPFYNYIIREGSITKSRRFEKHITDSLWIYKEWKCEFSFVKDLELKRILNSLLVKCCLDACAKYGVRRKRMIKEFSITFLLKNSIGIKQKMQLVFFLILPRCYRNLKMKLNS